MLTAALEQARLPAMGSLAVEPVRYGRVTRCEGPLINASGLKLSVGTLCNIVGVNGSSHLAEVIGFRDDNALLALLSDTTALEPGAMVRACGAAGMVQVGQANLGRAVDGMGQGIDGRPIHPEIHRALDGERISPLDRSSVTSPFDSGIGAINALMTMGLGQRVGIMAGSGVGKSVLIDMIARHADVDIIVLGLIGERSREVSDAVRQFMSGPGAARTALVAVPADHPPSLRLRGAKLAMSIAEHFRSEGKRVLLVLDSLTRVAHAAREVALLSGEQVAARGYPPSALGAITQLVERAGNARSTGGSITGLFTVLADGDDMNDPVVDTARAILDGHIVLSREIAQSGRYPAIDVNASLSRVMDTVVLSSQTANARRLRQWIARHEANRDLVMMGAYQPGRDPLLDTAMAKAEAIEAFLTQGREERISLAEAAAELAQLTSDAPAQ